MRKIDSIIVHCSATKVGQDFTAANVDRWHRERGFNGIGYHYIIRLDGKIEKGRDVSLPGAHCKGWNERSIGICYIGGVDKNGHPMDTRTNAQKRVLYQLIMDLQKEYGILQVLGHRDTSPDLNGDGVIEPCEYMKACPCFSMKEFMMSGRELLFVLLLILLAPMFLSGCKSGKEVVDRSHREEEDSCSVVTSGKSVVEQSLTLGYDSEVIEEHLERMICAFPLDTLDQRLVMMVKTVVDKRNGKEKQISAERELVKKDSIHKDTQIKVESYKKMKTVLSEKGIYEFLKEGIFVLLGLITGILIYKWIKTYI